MFIKVAIRNGRGEGIYNGCTSDKVFFMDNFRSETAVSVDRSGMHLRTCGECF